MNHADGNRGDRWLKWSLAALVVLNLALMASIWLPQLKPPPVAERGGVGGRERDAAQRFLEESLSLSPQQKEITARLRAAHFQKSDLLRKQINSLRRQIMEEVYADSPDRNKVARLAEQLGAEQARSERLTFDHFLELYGMCQPGQKEKFRSMMAGLLDRLKPPPESRRQPGETNRRPAEPEPQPGQRPAGERSPRRAEGPRSGEPADEASRVGNQLERLRSRLGLSDGQLETLKPLAERFAREIDACRSRAGGDEQTVRQAEKEIKDRRDEAIRALLTPAQRELFEQMKRERRGEDPRPGPAGRE